MLGWALKKGLQGATGVRDAPPAHEDDGQLDGPDTPAPVFAARAIKNAIWGQSGHTTDDQPPPAATKLSETQRAKSAANSSTTTKSTVPTMTANNNNKADTNTVDARSPNKLNSILLTPGTGAARRKRVSFGRDVKAGTNNDPSPFTSSATRDGKLRKKTTLQKALEDARSAERKVTVPRAEVPEEDNSEEEWEWDDEDVCCQHDVTLDLNDPHSESGKYWKAEWARYREEAKSDIEQLVKYKANARSFAAKKDTEASQLAQKLKEEQAKVMQLEKQIADMTGNVDTTRKHGSNEDNAALTRDLAKQTSLVAEYHERIKDLEAQLKDASGESNANTPGRSRIDASPRIEQSLIDTNRELRKARSELRQLERYRDEVRRLKSNLATSRERVAELEAQTSAGAASESSRITKLEKQLREIKEESRQKDTEMRKLKREYESLKRDAKSRTAEAIQVLQDKNTKIEELEKEIQSLKTSNAATQPRDIDAAIAEHNRLSQDLKESLGRNSRYERTRAVNGRARAASVQDNNTLDTAQHALLQDKNDLAPTGNRQEKGSAGGVLTDLTVDIPTLELQKQEKPRHRGTETLNKESHRERNRSTSRSRTARTTRQRTRHETGRTSSDALPKGMNEVADVKSRDNQHAALNDVLRSDRNQTNINRGVGTAQTAEDKPPMQAAEDRPSRRSRTKRPTHTTSASIEIPELDQIQERFTRITGVSMDGDVPDIATRRSLPADRQAAALARLQQRRMNRRLLNAEYLEKENLRP